MRKNTYNVMANEQKAYCEIWWLVFEKCAASVPKQKRGGFFG